MGIWHEARLPFYPFQQAFHFLGHTAVHAVYPLLTSATDVPQSCTRRSYSVSTLHCFRQVRPSTMSFCCLVFVRERWYSKYCSFIVPGIENRLQQQYHGMHIPAIQNRQDTTLPVSTGCTHAHASLRNRQDTLPLYPSTRGQASFVTY